MERICPKCGIRDCQCPEYLFSVIADKDAQIASLTSEIHGLKVTIQQRWGDIREQEKEIASLEDELMTKKVIIMSLNDLVSNSTTQVNRLEKEIASLKELVRDAMITLEYHGVASIYWLKRAKEFTQ